MELLPRKTRSKPRDLSEALDCFGALSNVVQALAYEFQPVGTVRRKEDPISQVDILAVPIKLVVFIEKLRRFIPVCLPVPNEPTLLFGWMGMTTRIHLAEKSEFPILLLSLTGPEHHVRQLMARARSMGLRITKAGIFNIRSGKTYQPSSERAIYSWLGIDFIEPEERARATI